MQKILVVTSCTGKKKHNPKNKLFQNNFLDIDNLNNNEIQLKEYAATAGKMYTVMQHLRLMEGINLLRNKFGKDVVDLAIVSAGYGLIRENKEIVPYEVTFNNMNSKEIIEWSKVLKINVVLQAIIKDYTMIFFLLGDKYLRSLELPLEKVQNNQKLIFLASASSKKLIPNMEGYYFIEVGQKDAKSFSYGLVGLKGYLFKLLAQEIDDSGLSLFNNIYQNPDFLLKILNKYRMNK